MSHNSPKDRKVSHKRSDVPRAAGSARSEQGAKPRPSNQAGGEEHATERVAKVMARSGACSRRDAEAWIEQGRVAVNGAVLHDPAVNVGADDIVTIDGTALAHRARTRLFRFHKPRGLVTTERDPQGRTTIFAYLREHWPDGPRVVSVGRLDINTEGLMLLTNDGGLARVLELPSTGWVRRYRVRVNGETDQARLDSLRHGVTIDGISYAGIEATLDRVQGANRWLTMSLREGKNREVKRVLEHLGLRVNRLIRLSFGPFQLGELAEGGVDEVRTKVLRDQLGPSLAEAAGADFLSPSGAEPEVPGGPGARSRHRPDRGIGNDRYEKRASRAGASPARDAGAVPKAKPVPRVRKHVSVLRREMSAPPSGPRKRVARAKTVDRSGRVVAVERVVAVGIEPAADRGETRNKTRNGRRFEALRRASDEDRARKPRYSKAAANEPGPRIQKARNPRFGQSERAKPGSPGREASAAGASRKDSRRDAATARGGTTSAGRHDRASEGFAREGSAERPARDGFGSSASKRRPERRDLERRDLERDRKMPRHVTREPRSDAGGSGPPRERPKGGAGSRGPSKIAAPKPMGTESRAGDGVKARKPSGRKAPGGRPASKGRRPGSPPRKT
jgi:23S rRNA pseudouridine2605 synthase